MSKKPKKTDFYVIGLTEFENEVLKISAKLKNKSIKDYILYLIDIDNIRQEWHREQMQQTKFSTVTKIFNNEKI